MNTKRDKVIALALGLCWHEATTSIPEYYTGCSCGFSVDVDRDVEDWVDRRNSCRYHLEDNPNPDFSTDSGMCLILRKGPEREWWTVFIYWLMRKQTIEDFDICTIPYCYLQHPDDIANELKQFLDERGGGK